MKGFDRCCLGLVDVVLLFVLLSSGGCQKERGVEQKTIRFTTWGSPASIRVYRDVVDEFKKRNPDIRVELMMLP